MVNAYQYHSITAPHPSVVPSVFIARKFQLCYLRIIFLDTLEKSIAGRSDPTVPLLIFASPNSSVESDKLRILQESLVAKE